MSEDFEIDLTAPAPRSVKKQMRDVVTQPKMADVMVVQHDDVDDSLIDDSAGAVDVIESSALVNQRIGRKSVIDAFTKLLTVTDLIDLQKIKETKGYKGAQVISSGKLVTVTTWSDYCTVVEGKSRESVDLEISNLDALGQPTFEALRKIGIGPSTMRSIRQLPDDSRALIEQVATTSNKDELIDLIDGLVGKHQKEKSELKEKLESLDADLTQAGRRAKNMDAEIERLTRTNERLVNKQRLTSFEPFTEDVRLECMHLQAGVELHLKSLQQLFYRAYESEQTAEQSLRIEQVYISIVAAVSLGIDLLEGIHERFGNREKLPDRIQAQHVLTPPEAERWLLEYESLKNAHNAAEAAREMARDKDKPRGRGRPAGSKNKDE